MRDDKDLLPGLDELGENLRRAAQQRSASEAKGRSARSPRRIAAVAVLGVLLAAGAATAAGLIAVGRPLGDDRDLPEGVRPRADASSVVVRAGDPSGVTWGASVYRSADGRACILAGQLRGRSLGLVENGRFRPYAAERRGSCGDLARTAVFFSTLNVQQPPRTLLFGRVREGARAVRVRGPEGERTVRLGDEGAFLLVYDGVVTPADFQLDVLR